MKVNCRLPKILKAWCEKHADRIYEIDYGGGYATESGFAYDILLNPGWHVYDERCHTIIEPTARETLRVLRSAKYDADCEKVCGR